MYLAISRYFVKVKHIKFLCQELVLILKYLKIILLYFNL